MQKVVEELALALALGDALDPLRCRLGRVVVGDGEPLHARQAVDPPMLNASAVAGVS